MENQMQNVAAPTVAPMIDAYPVVASWRCTDAGFSGRPMTPPAIAPITAHATGQVSLANATDVFIKAWAPPPRRVSL